MVKRSERSVYKLNMLKIKSCLYGTIQQILASFGFNTDLNNHFSIITFELLMRLLSHYLNELALCCMRSNIVGSSISDLLPL